MSRQIHRLNSTFVRTVEQPGRYADGGGLYLLVGDGKRWLFMFTLNGRRREMGLGSASAVQLAEARTLASEARKLVAQRLDPIVERERLRAVAQRDVSGPPTFEAFAEEFIQGVEKGFKNAKHRQQWRNALKTHAALLTGKRVDAITTDDVLGVLRPIWTVVPETASRVRGRIERILDAAAAKGFRDPDKRNPATWSGHLEHFLPKRLKKSLRGHHKAVPWRAMPAFWAALASRRKSTSAQALRFTILNADRTIETIGAKVREFDLNETAPVWTIPAERMKLAIEHQVPLSGAAAAIARQMAAGLGPDDYLFPGEEPGKHLSNMAMLNLLQETMGREETVHGFRSSFRDWAGEATDYPRELAEMALAHAVGDASEQAYRRERAREKRRPLMNDWAEYLGTSVSAQLKAAA